jgi:hypothetical protein
VRRGRTAALVAASALLALCWNPASGPASGGDAAVSQTRGTVLEGCGSVSSVSLPVSRGCRVKARGDDLEVRLITPLGVVPVGRCEVTFDLILGQWGDAYAQDVHFGGISPCGDIGICGIDGAAGDLPWPGEVHAGRGGASHLHLDACFDTCFGVYRGSFRLDLRPDEQGRLGAVADRAQVGDTALELDGAWRLAGPRLRVEPGSL